MSNDHAEPRDDQGLYATLGVPTGATEGDITRAYRRLARERHPDANPDAGADAFADLTDAYDILRDPTRRRAYDNTRRARADAASAAAGARIPVTHRPSAPAGGASGATRAREPSPAVELVLTFDQAALGTTVPVAIQALERCRTCGGSGVVPGPACDRCAGTGASTRTSGGITIRNICPACEGTGRPQPTGCPACDGRGRTATPRQLQVRVPAGVEDGTTLRLPGGDTDAPPLAAVRVEPHRYFGRNGDHLTVRLPITLAEAALGAVVTVPTLTGAVAIRVPPGTAHGRTLRVRGRGLPVAGQPGDLLATIDVVIPAELTEAQRRALEAFAAATPSPRKHFES